MHHSGNHLQAWGVSKISKKLDHKEETVKHPVVIGKDARQGTKCLLQKLNREGEILIIILDYKNGQKKAKEHV